MPWALALSAALVCVPIAAPAAPDDLGQPLSEVWLVVDDAGDLARAAQVGLTVAEGHRPLPGGRVEQRVIASRRALSDLEARGYTWRVERDDHRRGAPRAGYHLPGDGDAVLEGLAEGSRRAGLVQLGTSRQGRPILGLWLGQHPDLGAPTTRVLAAHHGDEWSSFEVALDLARTLSESDGADPGITALLDTSTVWVVPYVNPDGVVAGSRYNAFDVDLNRNYDYQWSESAFRAGPSPFSEPETAAVRAHAVYGAPMASLSLHAGAQNIGYPWNWTTSTPQEPAQLEALATLYADECTAPLFYVTQGADWYLTTGDTNDWSYGRYGGMDLTVELTWDKAPEPDEIPAFVDWHDDAVVAFLLAEPTLSGRVVDADTGDPVEAELTLDRTDLLPVVIPSHPSAGTFHRVAAPGVVALDVQAPGYLSQTVVVDIGTPAALQVQVALERGELAEEPLSPRRVGSTPTTLAVPGAGDALSVRLWRPGHAEVVLPISNGEVVVDPHDVAPGPWSVALAGGAAWPRGLFVSDPGPASLASAQVTRDTLELTGSGLATGTRAWGLWGDSRPWVPLEVVSQSETAAVIDLSGIPRRQNADVVVVSNGTQLAVLDVWSEPEVDTGDPMDTGTPHGDVRLERGGCTCGGGAALPASLVLFVPVLLRRRRR